jgi:hypothetical protein
MSVQDGFFSSESVSEGHPDRLADRISDAVLDEFLRLEPTVRVGDRQGPSPSSNSSPLKSRPTNSWTRLNR